jgi:hypothetical protein
MHFFHHHHFFGVGAVMNNAAAKKGNGWRATHKGTEEHARSASKLNFLSAINLFGQDSMKII